MNRIRFSFAAAGAVLIAALSVAACVGATSEQPLPKTGVATGPRFAFDLAPGPHYSRKMGFLFFSYTVYPQVAIWLEDAAGNFIDTVYVTEVAVTGDYTAAPKEGRPEALPVWSALKHRAATPLDAVSSPTTVGVPTVVGVPTEVGAVKYGSDIVSRLAPGAYLVKLETNRSYDWNAVFTKKNSGVNGQPSVVYQARVEVGGGPSTAVFEPIGTGSVDGADGAIRPGLAGIDTALELFSSIIMRYYPE